MAGRRRVLTPQLGSPVLQARAEYEENGKGFGRLYLWYPSERSRLGPALAAQGPLEA